MNPNSSSPKSPSPGESASSKHGLCPDTNAGAQKPIEALGAHLKDSANGQSNPGASDSLTYEIVDPNRIKFTESPSPFRGFIHLIWVSFVRQTRARTMVWLAMLFFALGLFQIWYLTEVGAWQVSTWKSPRGTSQTVGMLQIRMQTLLDLLTSQSGFRPTDIPFLVAEGVAEQLRWPVFFRVFVFTLFLNFLLPFWTLSFATEGIGGDRENQSLIWQLLRPIPVWSIYFARWLGQLPWSVGMVMLGLFMSCQIAGPPGQDAWDLIWPMGLCGALVYSSLFFWMGAVVKRPIIIGMAYVFFLEIFLGSMPGLLKRLSLSFYLRCMVMEPVRKKGIEWDTETMWMPVTAADAQTVLLCATLAFLILGAWHFSRVAGKGTCGTT